MYKIKKPEELTKGKKKDYINLYLCYTDMEEKYKKILYKYDKLKKQKESDEKKIDELNNKIIDLELSNSENVSMNVNMRSKAIIVVEDSIKQLKRLVKELKNQKYQEIIDEFDFSDSDIRLVKKEIIEDI